MKTRMCDAIDGCFIRNFVDLLWEVCFSAVGDAWCIISDAGSAVVLEVTLLLAVYTHDLFVGVVTRALVVRVVWLMCGCRILLVWLPGFLVVVVGFLECVRLAKVTLWSEIRADRINFFFLCYFRNVLLHLHSLELHISNFICVFRSFWFC